MSDEQPLKDLLNEPKRNSTDYDRLIDKPGTRIHHGKGANEADLGRFSNHPPAGEAAEKPQDAA